MNNTILYNKLYKKYNHYRKQFKHVEITSTILLQIALIYDSMRSGFNFKINQIRKLNWLTIDNLKIFATRMSSLLTNQAIFEQDITQKIHKYQILGYIDCFDINNNCCNIWEFKSVLEIKKEHFIQLCCYAYLWESKIRKCIKSKLVGLIRNYYLYNNLSNELYKLNMDYISLKTIFLLLLKNKTEEKLSITDEAFINAMLKLKKNIN